MDALVGKAASERSAADLRQVSDLISRSLARARSLAHELSPPVLHRHGLSQAVRWLAGEMADLHGLTVHLVTGLDVEPRSEPASHVLFRAARELLLNVVKHSGVDTACVQLGRSSPTELWLQVTDEGIGFAPHDWTGPDAHPGLGLSGLRDRLDVLGGRLQVQSRPGHGTTVRVHVPTAKRYVLTPR